MKNMFTSLNGAITLTVIALLAELVRAFADFEWEYSIVLTSAGGVVLGALLYAAVFGLWVWALLRAARGSRRALTAALGINVLILLAIPAGALFFYCPSPCLEHWPVMEMANWINLIFGLLAAAALVLNLRQTQPAR